MLREARSISYSKGPSGLYVSELLERLGLAVEMKDKTVFAIGRPVGEVVASGEAEIGMQQIIENQPVQGRPSRRPAAGRARQLCDVFGRFCSESGGKCAPARAFVAFLASPAAVQIIRAKGMEPA